MSCTKSAIKLILGRKNANSEKCSIEYRLLNDWNDGFSAQIVIANNFTWGRRRYIDMEELYTNFGYMSGCVMPRLSVSATIKEVFGTNEN